MGNIFAGLGNKEGVKGAEDRVGGFQVFETDIYEAEIAAMYSIKSTKGAGGVHLTLKIGDKEYNEDVWVTNTKGENTFTKDGVTYFLPGWNHVDHIALVATGEKGLAQLDVEDKTFKVYDPNAKQALPKSVPTFVEVLGKKIWVALVKSEENKSVKEGEKYVPTSEKRVVNSIDKVFDYGTKLTVAEATSGKPAEFFDAWLAQNKGKTRNNFKEVQGGGTTGRPAGAPPQGGEGNKPSLFGKK
ncbi:single-stranded DNA-binding protein [Rhizobium phage RHph_N38]|uniref:Single-stranded DNA-binding protein n=1 Tax=Rhizobium phage RHph_N38 TaxID=2509750 RepID=A0A7S5RED2_9CAUD|nr:single-stranded DNA-binding protein [Rhizobium phage RHph_N38]QIG70529.1 single-stranded DNA-binding protein [Rhizobium phage RHph_N38]